MTPITAPRPSAATRRTSSMDSANPASERAAASMPGARLAPDGPAPSALARRPRPPRPRRLPLELEQIQLAARLQHALHLAQQQRRVGALRQREGREHTMERLGEAGEARPLPGLEFEPTRNAAQLGGARHLLRRAIHAARKAAERAA